MTNFISHYILSILIFFPMLAGILIFLIPSNNNYKLHLNLAMLATIIEFIFSLHLICYFMRDCAFFQFAQFIPWLPKVTGINYIVGIDGLSLSLVLLATSLSMIAMLSAYTSVKAKIKSFILLFLLLESTLIGALCSLDIFLFYTFWEASLIPVYFMLGIWGADNKIYATVKMFIYGVSGSLFMLLALVYLYVTYGNVHGYYSANILDLYQIAATLPFTVQCWLFLALSLGFAIKVPIFPLYSWMIDVYEQAPAIYIIMSGVILKLATYALIRFSLCLFPKAAAHYADFISILALIGIIYGALIAWQQSNMRRIMAFSSLSHLGFIVLGIFALNVVALQGSLYQMLNHAMVSAALIILFNMLSERKNSYNINDFGGIAQVLPWFSTFFILVCLGAISLPGTGSFIGEWLILLGSFQSKAIITSIATLGVVFGAIYMLWVTHKILFGPIKCPEIKKITGLQKYELIQLSILIVCIYGFGFASTSILEHSRPTLLHIEQTLNQKKAYSSQLSTVQDDNLIPIVETYVHHN